jgi:hypothetical protein
MGGRRRGAGAGAALERHLILLASARDEHRGGDGGGDATQRQDGCRVCLRERLWR